jgi:hypothetical protein
VLQDLRYGARTGALGVVGRIALLGALSMPAEMVAEVEERMPRLACADAPIEVLDAVWRTYYLPHIDVGPCDRARVRPEAVTQLNERDHKDVPLLYLVASLESAVILSNDYALIELGYAPRNWLAAALCAEQVLVIDLLRTAVSHGVAVGAYGVAAVARAAACGSRSARLVLALSALAAVGYLRSPRRRAELRDSVGQAAARPMARLAEQATAGRKLAYYASSVRQRAAVPLPISPS